MASPTLKDYRDSYYTASVKAGDVARQLAFAGIALIWIFQRTAKESNDSYSLPEELYWPALFVVLALTCDLLQYFVKSAIWGFIQYRIERKYGPDISATYTVQDYLNWPALVLFWGKLLAIVIAYLLLSSFILNHVKFSKPVPSTNPTQNVTTTPSEVKNSDKGNSAISLKNNVTLKFIGKDEKPEAEPVAKPEAGVTGSSTALQNTVILTLPYSSPGIVRPAGPKKIKDPCDPCKGQENKVPKKPEEQSEAPSK